MVIKLGNRTRVICTFQFITAPETAFLTITKIIPRKYCVEHMLPQWIYLELKPCCQFFLFLTQLVCFFNRERGGEIASRKMNTILLQKLYHIHAQPSPPHLSKLCFFSPI